MRSFSVMLLLLLLLFSCFPVIVRASDDSNSGQLTTMSQIDQAQLINALNVLSQNINDTQLRQLINDFESQIKSSNYLSGGTCNSGNGTSIVYPSGSATSIMRNGTLTCSSGGAGSILLKIQSYMNSKNLTSGSLYALVKSLSVNGTSIFLDQMVLQQLLGLSELNQNGVPRGLTNESPSQASIDLQAIASLLSSINPDLAAQLLRIAAGIKVSQSSNSLPVVQPGPLPIQVNNIPVSPTVPSLPTSYVFYLVPILAVPAVLFLFRRKIASLLGEQKTLEDEFYDKKNEIVYPRTNKEKIIQIFQKAVLLLGQKGIRKMKYETHREFSERLSSYIFSRDFRGIAGLYEKAKFSNAEIKVEDVSEAEQRYRRLESS